MTLELDPSQKLAVRLMVRARLACVTGGAGCGKTTSLSFALDELDALGQSYRLAAPTGKAAKRMTETTGRPACTIHRLLEWRGKGAPLRCAEYPLETSAVIVDEASMIDIEMFTALLSAIDPARTRLIMMGDANQLPPVGPGCPFFDAIDSGIVPVATLTTLHRQGVESWINVAAQCVLKRTMPDLHTPRPDFRFIEVDDSAYIMPTLVTLITETIPKTIGDEAQVIIPQKPGVGGIELANTSLQNAINPARPGERTYKRARGDTDGELRILDRVIQTRNNYDLGVFNGEIGTVTSIEPGHVVVRYPDHPSETVYNLEQAGALQLAYALTVHKMQGSEFPWVVFVCHSTHTHMLAPQLIYTAITRGKKGCIIVGNEKGLLQGLRQQNPPRRLTGLKERLKGELTV